MWSSLRNGHIFGANGFPDVNVCHGSPGWVVW